MAQDYNKKDDPTMYIRYSFSVPESILKRNGIIYKETKNGISLYGIPMSFAKKHCNNL